jgi:hypothetical protein
MCSRMRAEVGELLVEVAIADATVCGAHPNLPVM